MWQKPVKTVLAAKDAFENIRSFFFFCVMSGMLGALLWECLKKKADWADEVSFGLLTMSMAIFYAFHIYALLVTRRHAKQLRQRRFMIYFRLACYLVSFVTGILIVSRSWVV